MRCLIVVALALALAACASAEKEQEKAKILEDRWPKCSKVVNGRLGAFHPFNTNAQSDWTPKCMNTIDFNDFTSATVTYSPCQASQTAGGSVLSITGDEWSASASFNTVESVADEYVTFSMPTKKGDQPNFVGTYLGTYTSTTADAVPAMAVVVTTCNNGLPDESVQIKSINMTTVKGPINTKFTIQLQSKYACPMFPYSGKAVPPGGVAAIVIVILCFVFQFGICAWYHKTQVVAENPFTGAEGEEYTNVE